METTRAARETKATSPGAETRPDEPRVVYYALGGGHGHVLRGLAVLKALGQGLLLGPARLAPWAQALGVAYDPAPEPFDPRWVSAREAPELLLVDVFPRGVMAELEPLLLRGGKAWLVARRVRESYYLRPAVRACLEDAYEQVLWTEPAAAALRTLDVLQRDLPAIVLDTPHLARAEARARLDVVGPRPLVLALASGPVERQARLVGLLTRLSARLDAELRVISSALPESLLVHALFPASALLSAADVVVSAAGYHAFHETQACGVPTIYLPQPRRYDDQAWRARDARCPTSPGELLARLREALARSPVPPAPLPAGAAAAAALLQARLA